MAAVTDTDLRKDLVAGARQEILRLGRSEVPPEELGDWRETIDSTLFMLFRSTELYRAPIRVMVVNSDNIFSTLYPEETMVLSAALLDQIDLQVFELAVNAPRRAKDHTAERERKLAPYLAYNAARFALNLDFLAFKRTVQQTGSSRATADLSRSLQSTMDEVHRTDLMACLFLDIAGYDSALYSNEFLPAMAAGKPASGSSSSPWFETPAPAERIRYLTKNREKLDLLKMRYATILQTLRTGTAWQDALSSIGQIREILSGELYLDRLEALVAHQYWLDAVSIEKQYVATFFPIATEESRSLAAFTELAKNRNLTSLYAKGFQPPGSDAGNRSLYTMAIQAYRRVLSAYSDPALSSAYAVLLYQGGTEPDLALREAESAARMEAHSTVFTARANHALLLFLSRTDPAEAQRILTRLADLTTGESSPPSMASPVLLYEGIPSDARFILINHAIILRSLDDHHRADTLIDRTEKLISRQSGGTVSFRGISLGATSSELADRWGNPDSILYNFFSEVWNYPRMGLVITFPQVEKGKEPGIIRIRMNAGSPVSPGGDIRTGDSRDQFEKIFGQPVYRAGDRDVYLSNGMRLSVQYLFDRIRSITASY